VEFLPKAGSPSGASANDVLGNPRTLARGILHVSRADARIRKLVERHGRIQFRPRGRPFDALVQSILSQQLNGKAAESIISKMYRLFLPGRPTAERLKAIPAARLRSVGVSPQKVGYLKDLAASVLDGKLILSRLSHKSDEEIILMMDQVKGVGRWTAQMVLIFSLGRPDVLPVDDFGIRTAIKRTYGLRGLPKPERIEKIAKPWHPFSTVACLYLWRSKAVT
jgi:DNA-3-methyladenine glycosylase II